MKAHGGKEGPIQRKIRYWRTLPGWRPTYLVRKPLVLNEPNKNDINIRIAAMTNRLGAFEIPRSSSYPPLSKNSRVRYATTNNKISGRLGWRNAYLRGGALGGQDATVKLG